MTHNAIQAVVATVKGYCEIHDSHPAKCGAAKQAAAVGIIGLGLYGAYKGIGEGHDY